VIILSPSSQNNPLNWSKNSLYTSNAAFFGKILNHHDN
jgi:hypothetical protein